VGSGEELKALLQESGIFAASDRGKRFLSYLALLEKWNSRINLTASTKWADLKPLFQEGIWAAQFYPQEAKAHLDLGTGAGFPAIPLTIMAPRITMDMVESREKKCAFLETTIHSLSLNGAKAHCSRIAELLNNNQQKQWDCISWKAIKIESADVTRLQLHSHEQTELWMFHGKELAVEDSEEFERLFSLRHMHIFSGRQDWRLSIYQKYCSA
jgi:16S rRNA (guanine(527)-N(7))-methyltransferase RsmG